MPPDLTDVRAPRTRAPHDDLVETTAHAVVTSTSLETLTRPFLDVMHKLTGVDSTYLTEVRPELGDQVMRYADNRGGLDISEGLVVDWQGSLCRRALESRTYATSDAATTFPGSPAQRELGITTFVSVPVVSSDNVLMGTLCGASSDAVPIAASVVDVMMMLARLIADQWERDRRHDAALNRAAQAEERLRQRASFLAEAEHKLKSPLTVLRGWSELLTDASLLSEAEHAEAHAIMRRAAADASRQVDQLLDEARSEVLSLQLQIEPVDLAVIIPEVARQLHGAASAAHTVTTEKVEPAVVDVDRDALWQVLWHLAENALKYSPDGGRIDLGSRRTDDGQVVITVTDEGLGIPTDVDVFAPFVRGGPDQVGTIPGTGLGLHIVRNLVYAMGGVVTAEPRDGHGSVFRVVLPLLG
jgi:signal transduction histidine kinase